MQDIYDINMQRLGDAFQGLASISSQAVEECLAARFKHAAEGQFHSMAQRLLSSKYVGISESEGQYFIHLNAQAPPSDCQNERIVDLFVPPPPNAGQIETRLKHLGGGLGGIPHFQEFLELFGGLRDSGWAAFSTAETLVSLKSLYQSMHYEPERILMFPQDAWNHHKKLFAEGRSMKDDLTGGTLNLASWVRLYTCDADHLLIDGLGRLAWLIEWDLAYVLKCDLGSFMDHFAQNLPLDGGTSVNILCRAG